MPEPQIQYCTTADGVSIAYAVCGSGPPLLFLRLPLQSHLAVEWQHPRLRRDYEWLAMRHTLVRLDERGTGLSQREGFDLNRVLDIEAVTEKLRWHQFSIFAVASQAVAAIKYAAAHPERVTRMVLWNGNVTATATATATSTAGLNLLQDWTTLTETLASVVTAYEDPAEARAYAALIRESVTQEMYLRRSAEWERESTDVTPLLRGITAPTLVVHIRESLRPLAEVRAIVAGIPNARLQSVEGKSAFVPYDAPNVAPWLEAFLTGEEETAQAILTHRGPPASGARRQVTTVLFTDMVGHTEMMQRLGDGKGREVLRVHERITREALQQHGGDEVKTDGDSFMATFTSPSAAVECTIALQRAFAQHAEAGGEPIVVRMGLNVGEPIEEEGDFFGSAVILAGRIRDLAGGGEILVPEAVRHMLSGKSFTFADRGEFEMKGFDDAVRLYEVRWQDEG